MAITILSDNEQFKAVVEPIRDGCRAVFYQQLKGWRKISHSVYDLPFHATCDSVFLTVQKLRGFP